MLVQECVHLQVAELQGALLLDRGRSSHSADRFFSVPEPSWNPYFPIFKHLIILEKLSSFLLSRPIFRNSHLLKLSSAMMIWAADHLMVDQRVRELLSTLIEEWGVNTFQRGVNFRALDQAYPESGLDKCAPLLFTPVISRLPAHRQISYHVSCSVIIGGAAREIAQRWLPASRGKLSHNEKVHSFIKNGTPDKSEDDK